MIHENKPPEPAWIYYQRLIEEANRNAFQKWFDSQPKDVTKPITLFDAWNAGREHETYFHSD